MRYLTLAAEYTGSCIKDDFSGQLEYSTLRLNDELSEELESWNEEYKKIIPLDIESRKLISNTIDALDEVGISLARKLAKSIQGEVKIKYYSEGRLKYIEEIRGQSDSSE